MKTIIITILFILNASLLVNFIKTNFGNKDFIKYKELGQIALDKEKIFEIDTFGGTDFVLHSGNNIIVNAGNKSLELRIGNENKIKITRDRIDIYGNLFINNKKYE